MARALLVIDVQNGMFPFKPHDAEGLLSRIATLQERARAGGTPLIFVRHGGGPGHELEKGTEGWHFHPRVAPKGNRSRLISDAVMHYVTTRAKTNLAEQLKKGAIANAQRDMDIAQEWFSVDEEAWQHAKPTTKRKK